MEPILEDILGVLTGALQQRGLALDDLAATALVTPKGQWNAAAIGAFRKHVTPNWLTLRRLLREASQTADVRAWLDALEEMPEGNNVPLVQLAKEAVYNNPKWPDGTARKEHAALGFTGMAAFFGCAALCFYSIILHNPLLIPTAVVLLFVLFALLSVWANRLQKADRAEYERDTLL